MDFVIGQPRSGTAFVSHLINACGDVVSLHQNLMTLTCNQIVPAAFAYHEQRCSSLDIERLIKFYDLREQIRVDSSWLSTWILEPLLAVYPEARFVHLVRDPRENVRAMFNEHDLYGSLFSVLDNRDAFARWCVQHNRPWLFVLMQQMLTALPRLRRPDWDGLSPFERNCAFWDHGHRMILDTVASRTGYLRLRLEDLREDAGAAPRLFEFLGLPVPARDKLAKALRTPANTKDEPMWTEIRRIKGRDEAALLPRAFADWPVDRQQALVRMCGETARRLGYQLEAS